MKLHQKGILATETGLARYLVFTLRDPQGVDSALGNLRDTVDPELTVVGLGLSLVSQLHKQIPGLREFPDLAPNAPSTAAALWVWMRGDDRGELFHRSRAIEEILKPGFQLTDVTDSFQYDNNRDLSGYEDGTENPTGDAAVSAAIVQNSQAGLDGSSFVAVQKWIHDFDKLNAMSEAERDNAIGRHIADNEEFDEAPESAHVKRSAQESYTPAAFIVRRSMPWVEGKKAGLMFVAFGNSLDSYEAILRRMLGQEDQIIDALFQFTHPETGAYFWCPPVKNKKLDLSLLSL